MFFNWFRKKNPREPLQEEYVDLILKIMNSPLWNGSDAQLRDSLPKDLNERTLTYAKQKHTATDL